jgi:hypothetical protein
VQRLWTPPIMAALLVATSSPSAVAGAEGATTITSDDGLVTLEVPAGALPEGEVVSISLRPPEEAPPELAILGGTPTQYLVEPMDVVFEAPARLVRSIPLEPIGRTANSPLPLGILAIRHSDATWAWLDGAAFDLDAAGASVELSGSIDTGGGVFAFVAGEVTAGAATPQAAGIAQVVVPETTVTVPKDLESAVTGNLTSPTIEDAAGSTLDETIATAGEALVYEVFGDLVVGQPFECGSAGSTSIESAFVVEGLATNPLLTAATGLGPTATSIRVSGSIDCFD